MSQPKVVLCPGFCLLLLQFWRMRGYSKLLPLFLAHRAANWPLRKLPARNVFLIRRLEKKLFGLKVIFSHLEDARLLLTPPTLADRASCKLSNLEITCKKWLFDPRSRKKLFGRKVIFSHLENAPLL